MPPLMMTPPVVFVSYVSCFVLFVSPGYAIKEVVFNSLVKNISGTQPQTVSQKVRSRVECAVTCASHQNCSTFMYDRRTNGCFMSDSEDIGFLNPVYVLKKKPAPTDQSTTTSVVSRASADLTTSTTEYDLPLTSVVVIETTTSIFFEDTASTEASTTFTLLYTGDSDSSASTKESSTLPTSKADSVTTIPEITTSITESETTTTDSTESVSTVINNVAMTSATSLITDPVNTSPTSTPASGNIAETSTSISQQITSSFDSNTTTAQLSTTATASTVVAEQTTEAAEPTTSIFETSEATTHSTTDSTGGTTEPMSTNIGANASAKPAPTDQSTTTSVVSQASADLTTSTAESESSLTSDVVIETTSSVVVDDIVSSELSTTFTLLYTGGSESSTSTKESSTLATLKADSVTTIPEITTSITESEATTKDSTESVSAVINNVAMTSATSLITDPVNPSPTSTPASDNIAETSTSISQQITSSFDSNTTTAQLSTTATASTIGAEQTSEAAEPTTSILETSEATTHSTTGSTGGTIEPMSTTIGANASAINCSESMGYTMLPIGVCIQHYSTTVFRNQAAAVCMSDGGHLLSIENEAIHTAVKAYLYNISSGHVWIDGYDADMDNNYTSWRGSDLQYIKWMPDNPTSLNRVCLGLHADENFDFNDLICDRAGQFVCQIDNSSPSSAASASSCPVLDGYFMFSVRLCLKHYTTSEIWYNASSICAADGGHLLVIENATMHAVIKTYLQRISSGSVWIDGFDADKDNVYKSWNGTELSYTKWAPDNPNELGAMCIGLRPQTDFDFTDRNCLKAETFICQIEI